MWTKVYIEIQPTVPILLNTVKKRLSEQITVDVKK